MTGIGRERRRNRGSNGRTGRSGEVRRSDYTRQLDRRKPEGKAMLLLYLFRHVGFTNTLLDFLITF